MYPQIVFTDYLLGRYPNKCGPNQLIWATSFLDLPRVTRSRYDSGSMDADIAPFDLRISLSAPKAWIWSRLNSACSRVVVRTITFPF